MTKSLGMAQKMIGEGAGALGEGARMADPRRMTPEEHGEAHALLVKAVRVCASRRLGHGVVDGLRR